MKYLLFIILSGLFLLSILLVSSCDNSEDAFKPFPVASFSVSDSTININSTVYFTDSSRILPSSWIWDFGDNSTSKEKDPSHTYTTAGTYMVCLIVFNVYGSDTAIHYIIVSEAGKAPIASFAVSDSIIKVGQSVTFTDKSANTPESWKWEFGDGKLSADKNTEYTYTAIGTYTVKLTVTNAFGDNSITKSIKVGNAPVAGFGATPTTIAAGESIQFMDSSTNSPASWYWEFGDGNTSIVQNPKYKYQTIGSYNVKLIVKNSFGADSITKTKYITVKSILDADGNEYKTVPIGTQVWLAENLKTTKFNDSTQITNITDSAKWAALTTPAYCWYENDEATYKNTYGALYNWHAVNTNKLCPTGWHVPIDAEWTTLINYLGGDSVAGGKLKETRTTHWESPNTGATNEKGFTALPGGYHYDGAFLSIGYIGSWWSATKLNEIYAWYRKMYYNSSIVKSYNYKMREGFSVRCIKD